jgi:hypothetical protein
MSSDQRLLRETARGGLFATTCHRSGKIIISLKDFSCRAFGPVPVFPKIKIRHLENQQGVQTKCLRIGELT